MRMHRQGYVKVGHDSFVHRLVAERALGKPLPNGAQVHHVDGDKANNKPTNLVICPDQEYHWLLHRRQSAVDAGFPANFLRCNYCKQYDDPANMYVGGNHIHHNACVNNHIRRKKGKA